MMVLHFSHDTTEDEVDRQFLRTALDLGINVPQDPKTTLELVTNNVSALDLNSTLSGYRPPPSRTSDSTHPTSCSSSEQRGHTKTASTTSTSMTSAPSSINSASSRKSSYTKIRKGFQRISTLKRRKTFDAPAPPVPVPVAAIKTFRPPPQHRPATVDYVPHSIIARKSMAPLTPEASPLSSRAPSTTFDPSAEDPTARYRSLQDSQLKELRWSQLDEQRRFVRFEIDQQRLMHTRQESVKKKALEEHPEKVKVLQDRHAEALSSLEHRHLSAEVDLERTLEVERQACETRLKHMQAYCNPRSTVRGMPSRVVTKQQYQQLSQERHIRDGMDNLHTARINVLREKQGKQLERIIAKQEAELEAADSSLAEQMQQLEIDYRSESDMVRREFELRRQRLTSRWLLAEAILQKRRENETGEAYGPLPPIEWNNRQHEDTEGEEPVDDELAQNARMAYNASTWNMI
ncbi:MAG: hypothetical protein Q9220_001881 [cf. Caloplaca sp. 1 TL-2023]